MKTTIKTRLLLSNLTALVFVAISGLIGYIAVHRLDVSMDAISANGISIKSQLQADQVHDALRADVLEALMSGGKGEAEQREIKKGTEDNIALFRKLMSEMNAQTSDEELKKSMAVVSPDVDAYLKSASEMVNLALSDPQAAQAKWDEFMKVFRKLEKSMADLSEIIERNSEASKALGDESVVSSRIQIIIVALLSLLVMMASGYFISRSILEPLEEAVGFASHIAKGDLSAEIHATDDDPTETGRLQRALRDMQNSLHGIVAEVRTGTDTIATASAEIATGSQDLSSRTEEQASSLEETASSLEEVTSAVRQNADNARQANQLAISASEVAVKGGDVVSQVVSTMGSINESSRKVVDIISVIDGIAFQTNILALNAAVEAARAGEQGRGFAVVASEVRNLAQRSAGAAKEIKALIGNSVEKVNAGSDLVEQAGSTMAEIVASVQRVTDIMGEIMAATQEQSTGIEQVNQAISQMDHVTQQNAALVEEAAAAAESMQEQAARLAKMVSVFKLDHKQTQALAAPPRPKTVATKPRTMPAPSVRPVVPKAPLRKPLTPAEKTVGDDWEEF